jgi:hypothetical protein
MAIASLHYEYNPLGPAEIRILRLRPGSGDDALVTAIEHRLLSDPREFYALSYTWGPPLFSHDLEICGGKTGRLKITESLAGALRRLRRTDGDLTLWADAVCINQQDIPERNAQVPLMEQIYRSAKEVFIWLGDPLGDSWDCAFGVLEMLNDFRQDCKAVQPTWDAFNEYFARLSSHSPHASRLEEGHIATSEHALAKFAQIGTLPWFERLWVFQELALAIDVMFFCGRRAINADDLHAAYSTFIQIINSSAPADDVSSTLLQRRYLGFSVMRLISPDADGVFPLAESAAMRLLELLVRTRSLRASQVHDRIFGIKALFSSKDTGIPVPDYSQEIGELWTATATCLLTESEDDFVEQATLSCVLALAPLSRLDTDNATSLPTWVPDFASITSECERKYMWYRRESKHNRAGGEEVFCPIITAARPKILLVSGCIVGRIETVLQTSRFPLRDQRNVATNHRIRNSNDNVESSRARGYAVRLAAWYMQCVRFASSRVHHLTNGDEIALLFRQGLHLVNDIQPPDDADSWASPKYLDLATALYASITQDEHCDLNLEDAKLHLAYLLLPRSETAHMDTTRLLAHVDRDRIGWVPNLARPGDSVYLLKGAPFPFILRNVDEDHFCVVGDAYVHGVMHSEALKGGSQSWQTFALA